MKVTADYRKQGFKSKKGVNAPVRRSELGPEERRMWLLFQCHELVKKERDKVVSSRRRILETADGSSTPELGSDPLFDDDEFGTPATNKAPDRPRTPADPQAMFRILIRAHFTSLEKELLDVYPALGESSLSGEVSDKPRRADNRSPTRPIELPSDTRRRNELRSDLGISPPSGHSVKIERLKRYDDETRTERFKKSLDSRGREFIKSVGLNAAYRLTAIFSLSEVEIRGLGNKRRNLGNILYLTDSLYPELDQEEDQSTPLLPPQVSGHITLPTADKSLRATLQRLFFPSAAPAPPQRKSHITVNTRRPYPKVKFRGKVFKSPAVGSGGGRHQPSSQPKSAPEPVPNPTETESDDLPAFPLGDFASDELPFLRIQTISNFSEIEDKPDLVAQAAGVLRAEFSKLGCEISTNRVLEGVEEGFGWDLVVLCTPLPIEKGRPAVREEVVAVLERTYMRSWLWVHHLCVSSKYQASGLGTWLMERCKGLVRGRKKGGILLFALKEVVAWYEKQGFGDFELIPPRATDWGGDKVMVWKCEEDASPV
jgi:GNAT superfamily N-acetyltransferase